MDQDPYPDLYQDFWLNPDLDFHLRKGADPQHWYNEDSYSLVVRI
jgi:hypothetical protein